MKLFLLIFALTFEPAFALVEVTLPSRFCQFMFTISAISPSLSWSWSCECNRVCTRRLLSIFICWDLPCRMQLPRQTIRFMPVYETRMQPGFTIRSRYQKTSISKTLSSNGGGCQSIVQIRYGCKERLKSARTLDSTYRQKLFLSLRLDVWGALEWCKRRWKRHLNIQY